VVGSEGREAKGQEKNRSKTADADPRHRLRSHRRSADAALALACNDTERSVPAVPSSLPPRRFGSHAEASELRTNTTLVGPRGGTLALSEQQ
jgi:hypothetical protein